VCCFSSSSIRGVIVGQFQRQLRIGGGSGFSGGDGGGGGGGGGGGLDFVRAEFRRQMTNIF